VSNTFRVSFIFCFSPSRVPYVGNISGLSILNAPSVFSNIVKSILPYACDIKKYELILVLRIGIFVRVERHVCLRTRTHFENKVQHDPIYGFIPATLLCLSQVSISRIVDHRRANVLFMLIMLVCA
jgi:hypothetical protein